MKQILVIAVFSVVGAGCLSKQYFDGPDFFEEDFEAYQTVDDMLLPDDELWSFTQLTATENMLEVDSTFSYNGTRAFKCYAIPSTDEIVSKASISKHNMAFWEGETMRVSGWYYIQGDETLDWLFILDLEEQTAIGAGPGIRLAVVDDCLMVEHKYLEEDIYQSPESKVPFPRNEWVYLIWEVKLSTKNDGSIRVYQNGELIISDNSTVTLPQDLLYFQQGTKGMYSSVEIGATANSSAYPVTLWVDDITMEIVE